MGYNYGFDGFAWKYDHKKKMERARKILNERTSIEPKVIGECPFCGKYVSVWGNSLEEDGLFSCESCHEPILSSANGRFTDDDMLRWCREKPERIKKID